MKRKKSFVRLKSPQYTDHIEFNNVANSVSIYSYSYKRQGKQTLAAAGSTLHILLSYDALLLCIQFN